MGLEWAAGWDHPMVAMATRWGREGVRNRAPDFEVLPHLYNGLPQATPRRQGSMVEAGQHKAATWWQLLLMTASANDTASVPPASGPGRPQAVGSHRPAPPLPLSRTTMTGCGRGGGGEQARAGLRLETRPTEELIKPLTRDGD